MPLALSGRGMSGPGPVLRDLELRRAARAGDVHWHMPARRGRGSDQTQLTCGWIWAGSSMPVCHI